MGNVITRADIPELVATLRGQGRRIVTTNGCFDLLHVGHTRYLNQARALGDTLIVGVNSDESVTRLKGPGRPINPAEERAEVLAALACVDYVVVFPEDTPRELLAEIRPDVHAKGGDYTVETLPEAETVRRHGGEIVLVPLIPERSTTRVEQRLRQEGRAGA